MRILVVKLFKKKKLLQAVAFYLFNRAVKTFNWQVTAMLIQSISAEIPSRPDGLIASIEIIILVKTTCTKCQTSDEYSCHKMGLASCKPFSYCASLLKDYIAFYSIYKHMCNNHRFLSIQLS